MTRALADLDLSGSIELLSGRGYIEDNQHSMTSCDTAELLRTPSPCVLGSDQEEEPLKTGNGDMEARNGFAEDQLEKDPGEPDQWAAISSIHRGKGQELDMQINGGIQSDPPATSTPKKQKMNEDELSSDTTEILEGRYEGSGYHRDGTRLGWYFIVILIS